MLFRLKIRIFLPITQKDFEKFIKGKGVKGWKNYKTRDLKAMFGFKPMFSGQRIILSLSGGDPIVYDSMTKASEATGVPISTIALTKERTKTIHPVTFKSKGNEYIFNFLQACGLIPHLFIVNSAHL